MDEISGISYNFPRINGLEEMSGKFRNFHIKESERAQIARETQEYLARGGRIHSVGPQDNHAAKQPLKRTAREQKEYETRQFSVRVFRG